MLLLFVCYAIVTGCVLGGFALAGGHIHVLWQPFEVLIIVGGALGAFVLSNSVKGSKKIASHLRYAMKKDNTDTQFNVDLLSVLYLLLSKSKSEGAMAVETDIESPNESPLFQRFPRVLADKAALDFIVTYMRHAQMETQPSPDDTEALMNADIKTRKSTLMKSAYSIQKSADGLPAFGIVAAVMGVVHVMGSVGQVSNSELGVMIAAALVGTFLGILLCYGYVGPLASMIEGKALKDTGKREVIREVLLANLRGSSPKLAVEYGRVVISEDVQPSFEDLESVLRDAKSAVASIASARKAA